MVLRLFLGVAETGACSMFDVQLERAGGLTAPRLLSLLTRCASLPFVLLLSSRDRLPSRVSPRFIPS